MQFLRKTSYVGLVVVSLLFASASIFGDTVKANSDLDRICSQNSSSSLCRDYRSGQSANQNPVVEIIVAVLNILLFLVGALAVIFVIWGGFKYITSSGDSNAVSQAKSTILYALAGLLVALVANRLIVFILNQFF